MDNTTAVSSSTFLGDPQPQVLHSQLSRCVVCFLYAMEEAAKRTVPTGKYVKVQCVRKSVPGLSSSRHVVLIFVGARRLCSRHGHP
jgi:hypothetical protein